MQYLVRALDASQQLHTLVLDALDDADAQQQARAWFAQELYALLSAGLSVIVSVDTLIEKDPQPARRTVLGRLAQQLREGQCLSAALRQQPDFFPPLFVAVVQAAEGTSDLPRSLARYLEYQTRLQAVRHKVVSAVTYPAILLLLGSGVSLFLLGYVVPKFAAVYHGSGQRLPWASQLLMGWGEFVGQHAALGAGAFAAIVVLLLWWLRAKLASGGWFRLLGLLPGARPKLEMLVLSRLCLTLGMLLESGIPLHQALQFCGAAVDPGARLRLDALRERIEAGEVLSAALEQHGLGTPVALTLLRVGEQSGRMGVMLSRTANFYDEEIARWVERFGKAFESVLMAAIGIVIGLIVILLYMPIFELAGSLQ